MGFSDRVLKHRDGWKKPLLSSMVHGQLIGGPGLSSILEPLYLVRGVKVLAGLKLPSIGPTWLEFHLLCPLESRVNFAFLCSSSEVSGVHSLVLTLIF